MHAPDGFLNAGTAVATGAISLTTVGVALRQAKQQLSDRAIPLAGMTAAFIFAAQLINFPVAAGTTGHLLGGALAAILLGPSVGVVVVAVVVGLQAVAFADGGLTALGYNVLNMSVIPAFGGYAAFRLFRRLLPANRAGVAAATGLAAWASVVMGAAAFSVEWLFGATAPVPFDTVFLAMVGVHVLIGVGEGVISALAVGAVLAVRPDLVKGASDLSKGELAGSGRVRGRVIVISGLLVSLLIAGGLSQLASGDPDGLERVAIDTGIASSEEPHLLESSWFAGYATDGIDDAEASLAIAGATGTVVVLAVVSGILLAVRERRRMTTREA